MYHDQSVQQLDFGPDAPELTRNEEKLARKSSKKKESKPNTNTVYIQKIKLLDIGSRSVPFNRQPPKLKN